MADFTADPEWNRWVEHVEKNVAPQMDQSAYCATLLPEPDKIDVKFCVELGMMIMMNKPIIAVVGPGSKVPDKLAMIADKIVEGSPSDPSFDKRLGQALAELDEEMAARQNSDDQSDDD